MVRFLWAAVMFMAAAMSPAFGSIQVQSVAPGSAAEAAGLRAGDRIARIAGRDVGTLEDLRAVMAEHRPGDSVPMEIELGR